MKITQKILMMFILSLSASVFAQEDSDLSEHIANKIILANQAFQKASYSLVEDNHAPGTIEFTQFFLGLSATGTFGINTVLSISVSPEITFIWEKVDNGKYNRN